jgi:uncharacterized membrane-anchored protein
MMMTSFPRSGPALFRAILPLFGFFFFAGAGAQDARESAADDPRAKAAQATWARAQEAMLAGPQAIPLKDEATLALPAGYGFVPRRESVELLKLMGNESGPELIGLVFPLAEEKDYFLVVDYEEAGYVSDAEAKEWDADDMLDSLKEGTEAANLMRRKQGVPAIQVTRWVEPPKYDGATHRLIWSAEVRLKDAEDPNPGVNYNTYVLGREGYVSLNLVTSASTVEADKPAARELLSAIDFNEGRRYADFDSSTDKVAAYGIAALVGGVAAKKLGLLALIAAGAAKFAKLIFIAIAAYGAGVVKWFRGRTSKPDASA